MTTYLERERQFTPDLTAAEVPADAVTTSASGVDPQISYANAEIQANRVAAERDMPLDASSHWSTTHRAGRCSGSAVRGP